MQVQSNVDPGMDMFAVTPADSDFAGGVLARGFYVGTGGNVRVTSVKGNDVTFKNVPSGAWMPGAIKRVWATNTTAADIVAVY
jgi:hypothetical protein